jgi:iron complex outermembrane receptor protein
VCSFPNNRKPVVRRCLLLFIAGILFNLAQIPHACAQDTNRAVVLPTTTVIGSNTPSAHPSFAEAQQQKRQVPGALTIRGNSVMNTGRGQSFQDLLGGIPGVTLQSENGIEVSKYSSRGSGILSEDEPLGVIFLLDGFPFNQGDGEVILEDFSLGSIQYAEVFRGANAFKYGAITLGGAVNLVSKTGYDASPLELRLEGGSYGFMRAQVSSGGVEGPVDYYVALTGRTRDGYRQHSYENTEDLFFNLGYKISDNFENRLYLSATRTDRLIPGGITKEQMNADPTQVDPEYIQQSANKEWYYFRVADKVSFKTERENAEAGVYWWHRNLLERDLFDEDNFDGIQGYYSDNYGFLFNSDTHLQLFNHDNNLTIGMIPTLEIEHDGDFQNNSGHKGALTGKDAEESINAPFYAEDQQYVTEKLSLVAGIQAIYVQRHFRDYFTDTVDGDQSANLVFRTVNPKAGAIYELDDKSQVYANVSRSWQPPSFDNMVDFDDDNPPAPFNEPGSQPGSLAFTPLQPQRAWTVEIGTRGEKGPVQWELSLYRTWVRKELLEINNSEGTDIGSSNIDNTYHQGIEAGVEIDLLHPVFERSGKGGLEDRLTLEQTYTLNDFRFVNNDLYGNNRIAGIPVHVYEAELMYETPCGFYAGPNVQWNITRYPADNANTLYADPYALLGFKMGWRSKKGFSIFFEAKNLTDKIYAASVDPVPDAAPSQGPFEVFHPGDGRSFYAGVAWALQ